MQPTTVSSKNEPFESSFARNISLPFSPDRGAKPQASLTLGKRLRYDLLTYFLAAVWLGNGLFAKVLLLVPRHREIGGRIIGEAYAGPLTFLIGLAEIVMALWILTKFRTRLNAVLQMAVVATMNILEFVLVPDLLLWGRLNVLFATGFIGLVYYWEFHLAGKTKA